MIYPAAKVFADDISLHTLDAPALRPRTFRVSDETGPANLKLDRGETADIELVLYNAGSGVSAMQARLISQDPELTVVDGSGAFGPAAEGDTTVSTDGFRVCAGSEARVELPLYCDLILVATGYTDTVQVPLVVGDSMNLPTGPDDYGYVIYDHTDSCYDRMPVYDWVELRGLGTELVLGEDDIATLALPESFGAWQWYGSSFDSISICSNGFVVPGTGDRVDFVNVLLPYRNAPPNILAVVWDNLHPPDHGHIWYHHDQAGHRFIVEFDSLAYFATPGRWDKVQVQVFDQTVSTPTGDNSVVIHLKTANYFDQATIGMQNSEGSTGLTQTANGWYPRTAAPLTAGRSLRIETLAPTGMVSNPAPVALAKRPSLRVAPSHFRKSTRVSLLGPVASNSALVYAADGGLVATLSRTGSDGWTWNGTDDSGIRVRPGTYFIRVGHGPKTLNAKAVLVAR
ncbi:MAG: hypothetical protein JSU73_12320 [candidate division WOR-3 bacterium]|nr:MAG: hypothetical protein JSU73_12320 [candidate division WOR-3 bacterium]